MAHSEWDLDRFFKILGLGFIFSKAGIGILLPTPGSNKDEKFRKKMLIRQEMIVSSKYL